MSNKELDLLLVCATVTWGMAKEKVTMRPQDAQWLVEEIYRLRAQVEGHCERIAAQSAILSKRAEKLPCT